jgi:serine/threonine-protein kinase
MEHAHAYGIIHRDLKPGNVLIALIPGFPSTGPSTGSGRGVGTGSGQASPSQGEGRVKLVDFGLARTPASQLTTEGAVVGTVSYLAPEQAMGETIDGRADLYAFGVYTESTFVYTANGSATTVSD